MGSTGIGIVIGALLTPYVTSPDRFDRTTQFGFAMLACIVLALIPIHWGITVGWLLLIGAFGGLFLIPMNTKLQQEGHHMVGAGKTIAIQNFSENIFMMTGIALTRLILSWNIDISITIGIVAVVFGLLVLRLRFMVSATQA